MTRKKDSTMNWNNLKTASALCLAASLFTAGCSESDPAGPDGAAGGNDQPASGGGVAGGSNAGSGGEGGAAPLPHVDPSCYLDGAAFCDAFTEPSPGGRAGALDDAKWGFSRMGFGFSNDYTFAFPESPINECGTWNTVKPGGPDSTFCAGEDGVARWAEGFDDNTSFQYLSARVRQPFDFAGRTGTLQWEADARTSGTHGWWVEVWFTDEPVPGSNFHAPDQLVSSPNAVGVVLGLNCGVDAADLGTAGAGKVGVSEILSVRDYAIEQVYNGANFDNTRCVNSEQGVLNKFQFKLSGNHIEVLGSDAGGDTYVSLGEADLDLPFSRASVHFSHVHYNAHKANVTSFQSYQWARIAFDGPQLPVPRAYSVPDSLTMVGSGIPNDTYHIGYGVADGVTYDFNDGPSVPKALVLPGVDKTGATAARLLINTSRVAAGDTLRYRFNGGDWRDYVVPAFGGTWERQGFVIPVDVADLAQGDNTLELSTNSQMSPNSMQIANIDLELDAP
jgi:hypothetical protein